MTQQTKLGLGFMGPAILIVVLLFLAPVLLTGFFAFTNMSTATGISGGTYRITETVLNALPTDEVRPDVIASLSESQFVVDEAGLEAMRAEGLDPAFIEELARRHGAEVFTSGDDLEDAMKDLDNRPRSIRVIKGAVDMFERSLRDRDFTEEAAFTAALDDAVVDLTDNERVVIVQAAYSGWTMTTGNFSRLWATPQTGQVIINTFFYVAMTLLLFNVGFALVLAITTTFLPAGQSAFFRAIWFLPRISPSVLYVLLWKWLAWDTGFINAILGQFGVPDRNWMLDTTANAWVFVILINGFVGASMGMIIFTSAIRAIPKPLFYAAQVDGASRWQQVRFIILPQLVWPLLFVSTYQTLSLLTSFEYILLSTEGGPGSTTEVWSLSAYQTALSNYAGNLQYGYGAAMALVLVAIGVAASLLFLRLFNFKQLVGRPRIEQ
ncbi:MAG: sugar ABC transporter permease [Pseudomonadota bacterium]